MLGWWGRARDEQSQQQGSEGWDAAAHNIAIIDDTGRDGPERLSGTEDHGHMAMSW